jgi:hypothetical protein
MTYRTAQGPRERGDSAMPRVIHNAEFDRGAAEDRAVILREQGRHPRIYPRVVRAENITCRVWIVVADERTDG